MLFKEVRVLAKNFMFCLSNVTYMFANNYIVRFHFDNGEAMRQAMKQQEMSARDCNSIIAIAIDGRVAKNPFLKDSSYKMEKDKSGNALIDPDIRDWIKSIFFNSPSANVAKMEGMPNGKTFQGSSDRAGESTDEFGTPLSGTFGGNSSSGSFYGSGAVRKKQESTPPIFPFLADADTAMEDAEHYYGDFAGRR